MIRLQKYIADAGVASRRKAEELIAAGKVKVNGKTVSVLGVKVDEENDIVSVNGKEIKRESKKYYIMLNKPAGYVTTVSDSHAEATVMELVSDINARIYPVGRLDTDTEGLLIFTNDGDFAQELIHPSKQHKKYYLAEVQGLPELNDLKQLQRGVDIGGYTTKPAEVELKKGHEKSSVLKIGICEGKKRQVRLMCEAVGHKVIRLKRIQIGDIMLGNLPVGKWRHLKKQEIDRLVKK